MYMYLKFGSKTSVQPPVAVLVADACEGISLPVVPVVVRVIFPFCSWLLCDVKHEGKEKERERGEISRGVRAKKTFTLEKHTRRTTTLADIMGRTKQVLK
ncbi:hypothetical protein DQ04_06921040 [Trypanosoma grayi]|uniref:hypothetical protein n=1 Tax=Trypanosoma grayi TaxID=71804 RepID=UPI0004F481BC|nr:hypothetical protein DQ04_06921040 [Trypanosoma grayi]KEG08558.1 hypothetical protein DQ04_06921040 [Trypanosoma grayi]